MADHADIRRFFRQVRDIGIETPKQFAITVRLYNVIRKQLGAEEDDIEPLAVSLYSAYDKLKSTDAGAASLLPNQAAKYVVELFEIAKKENIPISEVSKKLNRKIEKAQQDLKGLEDKKEEFENKKQEAEHQLNNQLQTNNLTMQKIEELAPLNAALAGYHLSPKEGAELMHKIKNLERRGYDIKKIAKKIVDMETLERQEQSLKKEYDRMKKWLEEHAPLRGICEELIDAGFDNSHLRRIRSIIGKIGKKWSFSRKAAIKKLLLDMELYEGKLDLEEKIGILETTLEKEKGRLRWYNYLQMNQRQLLDTLVYTYQKGIAPEYMKRVCEIIAYDYKGNALLFEKDLENGRTSRERSTMMQERGGAVEEPSKEALPGAQARPETPTDSPAAPLEQTVRPQTQQNEEEVASTPIPEPGQPHADNESMMRAPEGMINESPAGRLIAAEGFRQLFFIPNAKFPEVREALDASREKIGLEFDDNRILAAVIKEINR